MKRRIGLSIVGFLAFIAACSEGSRPFLMAQICVKDENGRKEFIRQLYLISEYNHMKFIDNSDRTNAELELAKRDATQLRTNGAAIHVAIEGEDGLGMTAGNLGLPKYQIVIGFSSGDDRVASERFANSVLDDLSSHWPIEKLDNSKGAKAMQECT